MHRAALLAVILLSVPAAAGSLPPSSPPPETVPSDAARIGLLTLEPGAKSGFTTPSLDVGTSLAIRHDAAATRLDRYALDARLANASGSARRDLLFSAVVEARAETAELRERERALRMAYLNGSIDTATLVRGLARIGARSVALGRYLAAIDAHADRTAGISFGRRRQAIESRLIEFRGPVRDRALASIRGSAPPTRLYAGVSRDGVALAMLDGTRYVREAYRADRRSAGTDTIPLDRVVTRMRAIYPTAFNESIRWGIGTLGGGVYRITFDLQDGSVTAYVHGGTRDVFYEVRDRGLTEVASPETATAAANGTRLVVNRSYPGGPLRVATYDNATGDPVAAAVVVAGTRLRTGGDGIVWTLTPDAARFVVTASRPGGNVTTFVRPLTPGAINGSA